jgi:ferredoxin
VKVSVDRSRCQGHARCWETAPEVYDLDDLGYCCIDSFDVPPSLEDDARRGAAACPERAIMIHDDAAGGGAVP